GREGTFQIVLDLYKDAAGRKTVHQVDPAVLPSRKPAQRDLEPFLHHVLAQIFKFQGAQVLIFQHILSPPLAVRSDSHCLTAQLYHKNTGWYRAEQKLPMTPEERLI